MDVAHYQLYRAVTLLAQASLGRISDNVIALGVCLEDDEPIIGLHVEVDTAADRQAFESILEELDEYYGHDKAIRSVVTTGATLLRAHDWTYIYLRRDAD